MVRNNQRQFHTDLTDMKELMQELQNSTENFMYHNDLGELRSLVFTQNQLASQMTTFLFDIKIIDTRIEQIRKLQFEVQNNFNYRSAILHNNNFDSSFQMQTEIENFTKYYSFPSYKFQKFQQVKLQPLPILLDDHFMTFEENVDFVFNSTHLAKPTAPYKFMKYDSKICAHTMVQSVFSSPSIKNCHLAKVLDPKNEFIIHRNRVSIFTINDIEANLFCTQQNFSYHIPRGASYFEYTDSCTFTAPGFHFKFAKPLNYTTEDIELQEISELQVLEHKKANFSFKAFSNDSYKEIQNQEITYDLQTRRIMSTYVNPIMGGTALVGIIVGLGFIFWKFNWFHDCKKILPTPKYYKRQGKYQQELLAVKHQQIEYIFCACNMNFYSKDNLTLAVQYDDAMVQSYLGRIRIVPIVVEKVDNIFRLRAHPNVFYDNSTSKWYNGQRFVYGFLKPSFYVRAQKSESQPRTEQSPKDDSDVSDPLI